MYALVSSGRLDDVRFVDCWSNDAGDHEAIVVEIVVVIAVETGTTPHDIGIVIATMAIVAMANVTTIAADDLVRRTITRDRVAVSPIHLETNV